MNLLHRDDFDGDELEEIQKLFPGMKIVCAGDMSRDMPEEIKEKLEELRKKNEESMLFGKCIGCDVIMPGYPLGDFPEGWEATEGWVWFSEPNKETGEDDFVCWQCPECNEKEEEEWS